MEGRERVRAVFSLNKYCLHLTSTLITYSSQQLYTKTNLKTEQCVVDKLPASLVRQHIRGV